MLKFGTSGLRGKVTELTNDVCYSYTIAFLKHLNSKFSSVAIAGDLRGSTPAMMKSVGQAIKDCGYRIDNQGFIPTPAIALYGYKRQIPTIMVTGSHIPDDRNGIKFNLPDGEILKDDEQAIVKGYKLLKPGRYENLPAVDSTAKKEYIDRYTSIPVSLEGRKIIFYQHSSVGRDIIPKILQKLGASVILKGFSNDFIPVDTESVRDEDLELACKWSGVAIVSADGDGDRPLVFDEHGNWIRGDVLGIITARYLKADSVSMPISCNTGIDYIGAKVNKTMIGSPYVIAGMNQDMHSHENVMGYEANGGFLLGTDVEINGYRLAPLPTRDAVLPILCTLLAAPTISKTVSELHERHTYCRTLKETPTVFSLGLIDKIRDRDKAKELLGIRVDSYDFTDGARMTLHDKILHIRPSGNAPELRIYTEAGSKKEAINLCDDIARKISCLD